jgi:3-oxoacyl-[acyl-carrier protein] reductase
MSKSAAIVTDTSPRIRKARAPRLARDFGAIALVARNGENLREVCQEVKAIGAEPLERDLTAPTATDIVAKKALDRFGRIDALVNIAGAAGLDM